MRLSAIIALAAASAALGGCDFISDVFGRVETAKTVYGAAPATTDADQPIDLATLIAPDLISESKEHRGGEREDSEKEAKDDTRAFAKAEQDFYDWWSSDEQAARRNQIQEILIAKSTKLCDMYKKTVLKSDTTSKLFFGDAATVLGGLGAAFTRTAVVRPLLGGTAAASGLRSEYSADVFASLNIQVITNGIEKRRNDFYAAIVKARGCTIQQYPLDEAVKDALYFHSSCSLYAGLEEANKSIHEAQNPGLDQVRASLKQLAAVNRAAQNALSASKANAEGAATSRPSAPPIDLSVTSSTQPVGSECQIPLPGRARSSVPVAPMVTVMTPVGAVTMSFSQSDDPLAALNQAEAYVESIASELYNALAALGELKEPPPGLETQKKKITEALNAFDITINPIKEYVADATKTYYSAYQALGSATNADIGKLRAKLEVAHSENAHWRDKIKFARSAFRRAIFPVQSYIKDTKTALSQ